jgi:hypothetical protein
MPSIMDKNNNSIKSNLVAYIWEKNFGDNLSTLCAQCMYQFIQKIILNLFDVYHFNNINMSCSC